MVTEEITSVLLKLAKQQLDARQELVDWIRENHKCKQGAKCTCMQSIDKEAAYIQQDRALLSELQG
jgi:hypothetical protein